MLYGNVVMKCVHSCIALQQRRVTTFGTDIKSILYKKILYVNSATAIVIGLYKCLVCLKWLLYELQSINFLSFLINFVVALCECLNDLYLDFCYERDNI